MPKKEYDPKSKLPMFMQVIFLYLISKEHLEI